MRFDCKSLMLMLVCGATSLIIVVYNYFGNGYSPKNLKVKAQWPIPTANPSIVTHFVQNQILSKDKVVDAVHKPDTILDTLPDCMTTRTRKKTPSSPLPGNANLCKAFTGTTRVDCVYKHPNIVYYVKLTNDPQQNDLSFQEYLSIFSVHRFYQPDKIVIYCNHQPITGKYWEKALNLSTPIELKQSNRITSIGKKHSKPHFITHEADYIKVSNGYREGGIYSDFDVVILNGTRLREMQRKSEVIMGRDNDPCSRTCAGFFSCVPGSGLMEKWLESYENDYHPSSWVYNAGTKPSSYLSQCPSCYDVIVDNDISNWDEAPGWGKKGGKLDWRKKAVAHYMNKGFLKPLGEPKELLKKDIPFVDMVKHVLGDTLKDF